ncbi:ABC-type transport auxiliary lipoprotein family protein [Luteimonas kalidii]|uniref:ABC-type transport auxiliary lipoprotein family protein n=1 Tax=Luteimonas kalidii TaxID=3042025 RepID=A0ABT6JVJ0_9GAMM|nr:ABC-type transport auxiliary lipoprotein family protein [Luteimonas kalidii]MDH5834701.1 ABC-type transport auxiliary lipoprotein family protein [Luteimonas kalidii]
MSRPAVTPSGTRRAAALLAPLLLVALGGCSLLGGGGERERSTIYAPDPRVEIDPSAPAASWQLSLSPPSGARSIDSFRIAVRPTPDELQVYSGAAWAKTPTDMLQDALLRALEDSGKLPSVARQGAGIAADYKLAIDLRRFEADYAGNAVPAATIEINAKLIHTVDQGIVDARTFSAAEPAAGTDVALVVDAFSRSLSQVTGDLAHWVLATGDRHEREEHPATGR